MEHSVDLSAKTFVQAISPSSSRKVLRKIKMAFKAANVDNADRIDLDTLNLHLANFNLDSDGDEDNEGGDTDDDDASNVGAADSVGKALALVTQVQFPPV